MLVRIMLCVECRVLFQIVCAVAIENYYFLIVRGLDLARLSCYDYSTLLRGWCCTATVGDGNVHHATHYAHPYAVA